MKYKITDLMDLYEDKNCPLTPLDKNMQTIKEVKEILEVKASKHAFDWKQGLAIAASAALLVAGGFGAKKLLDQSRDNPLGTGREASGYSTTQTSTEPHDDPQQPAVLDSLAVGDGWKFLPEIMTDSLLPCPASGSDPAALPVYLSPMASAPERGADARREAAEAMLRAALEDAANWLNAPYADSLTLLQTGENGSTTLSVEAHTSAGTITIREDGLVVLRYDLARSVEREKITIEIMHMVHEINKTLPLQSCELKSVVVLDQQNTASASFQIIPDSHTAAHATLVWGADAEEKQTRTIHFLCDSQNMLTGLYWKTTSAGPELRQAMMDLLTPLGEYPILTRDEALAMALEGKYYSKRGSNLDFSESRVCSETLAYPSPFYSGTLMPYYSFWIKLSEETYTSVVVPAIRPEYLAN